MKTIILPTDFSESARNAALYAFEIFGKNNCRFLLVNCWQESYPFIDSLITISDILKEESEKSLHLERDFLQNTHPGIKIETQSLFGELTHVILTLIEKEKADLIIMGTKGANGLKEVLVGSNTADIIQNVTCPVIAVPLSTTFVKPCRIVFTTDLGNINNVRLITPLLDIAKKYHSTVLILNLMKEKEKKLSGNAHQGMNLHQFMHNIEYETIDFENVDAQSAIEKLVETKKPDLLAILTKKQSFWKNILRSGMARNLVHHTNIPLLTMHDDYLEK